MRITYKQLADMINTMTVEQQNMDLTVEIFDGENTECFAATIRIADEDHDSLDYDHPIIWVNQIEPLL